MDDKILQSLTGTPEVAESSDAPADSPSTLPNPNPPPSMKKLGNSQITSATNSPKPSRETSPIRPPQRPGPPGRAGSGRTKKPGSQEVSPSRSNSGTNPPPLSSTTHKTLSATAIPHLHPSQPDPPIKAPIPQKAAATGELKDVPRWPISPRLRSPPPIHKPVGVPRKTEQDLPVINLQRTTTNVEGTQSDESEDALTISGMRTPVRGANQTGSVLETVQEISQPGTPAFGLDGAGDTEEVRRSLAEQDSAAGQAFARALKQKPTGANESGSESGGNKGEIKMRSTTTPASTLRPTVTTATRSLGAGSAGRGKPSGEGSSKNMTVETETVSSIPQVAVGGGTGGAGSNSGLRAKPSSETIRPKREKKKTTRKTPSVTSGNGEPLLSAMWKPYQSRDFHSLASPRKCCKAGPYATSSESRTKGSFPST
jgi:Vacuolar segregation subunit 7